MSAYDIDVSSFSRLDEQAKGVLRLPTEGIPRSEWERIREECASVITDHQQWRDFERFTIGEQVMEGVCRQYARLGRHYLRKYVRAGDESTYLREQDFWAYEHDPHPGHSEMPL